MPDKIKSLLKKNNSDFQAFAKLLTAIDQAGIEALQFQELLEPKHLALRIGITGAPGAGKSTLISTLLQQFSKKSLKVGVLAIDPSSPFSKGALLGDRIRYHEALRDPNIFVRSIGTRGSLGGLSSSTYLMLRAFDHFHFDLVLIETVGVGQTELEVMNVADLTGVMLVPEAGDGIQMMKAGLMEIADFFIVNKFDRPGAQSLLGELKLEMDFQERDVDFFSSVATEGKGVEEISEYIFSSLQDEDLKKGRFSKERLQAESRSLLRGFFETKVLSQVEEIQSLKDMHRTLKKVLKSVSLS